MLYRYHQFINICYTRSSVMPRRFSTAQLIAECIFCKQGISALIRGSLKAEHSKAMPKMPRWHFHAMTNMLYLQRTLQSIGRHLEGKSSPESFINQILAMCINFLTFINKCMIMHTLHDVEIILSLWQYYVQKLISLQFFINRIYYCG